LISSAVINRNSHVNLLPYEVVMMMLSRFHRRNACVRFRTLILTLTFAAACSAQIQPPAAVSGDRIEQYIQLIRTAEQQQLSADLIGYRWAVLASEYRKAGNFTESEGAYFKALSFLERNPSAARNYATALDNLAMLYLAYGRLDEAERYNRRSAKIRSGLGYPLDDARSEQHMAEIDLARHRFKAVEDEASRALEVMTRVDDPEKQDLLSALNALAFARCSRGACKQGIEDAQRSLTLARSTFGEESEATGHSLLAVGFAEWKLDKLQEADQTMRSSIRMLKAHEGSESRGVLFALIQYRNYLKEVHRDRDAENIASELSSAMQNQAPMCTTCVNVHSLSNAMK
jgi:tetratricopeptide (TPR) repeat protein